MAITFYKGKPGEKPRVTYSWIDKQGNRQRVTLYEGEKGYEELKASGGSDKPQEFGAVTTRRLLSTVPTVKGVQGIRPISESTATRYQALGAASARLKLPKDYDKLTPIEQFNAQKNVGLIPKDATFSPIVYTSAELAKTGKDRPTWGYLTREQVKLQTEATRERTKQLISISKQRTIDNQILTSSADIVETTQRQEKQGLKEGISLLWDEITKLFGTREQARSTIRNLPSLVTTKGKEYTTEFKQHPSYKIAEAMDLLVPGFYTTRNWSNLTEQEKLLSMSVDVAVLGGIAMSYLATAPFENSLRAGLGKGKLKTSLSKVSSELDDIRLELQKQTRKYLTVGEANDIKLLTIDIRDGIAKNNPQKLIDATKRLKGMKGVSKTVSENITDKTIQSNIDALQAQDRVYSEFLKRNPKSPKVDLVKQLQELNRRQLKTLVQEKPRPIVETYKIAEEGKYLPSRIEKAAAKQVISKSTRTISVEGKPIPISKFTDKTIKQVARKSKVKPISIVWAVSTLPITEVKTFAIARPDIKEIIDEEAKTSPIPMIRLREKVLELPITKTQPEVRTEPKVQPQVRPQPQVQPQVQPKVSPKQAVKPRTSLPVRTTTQRKLPKIPIVNMTQKEKRIAFAKPKYHWKQGFGWWAVNELNQAAFFKKPLPTWGIGKGKTPAETIQVAKGAIPPDVTTLNLGIQDIVVNKPGYTPGKAGAIDFEADLKQRTPADITLGRSNTGISKLALGTSLQQLVSGNYKSSIPEDVINRMLSTKVRKATPSELEAILAPIYNREKQGVSNVSATGNSKAKSVEEVLSHLPDREKKQIKLRLNQYSTLTAPIRGLPKPKYATGRKKRKLKTGSSGSSSPTVGVVTLW